MFFDKGVKMKKLFAISLFLGFIVYPYLSEPSDTFDNHFDKGLTYYQKRNFKMAIKEFDEALKIDLNVAKVYYYMGYAKYKKKDFKGAIKDFNKVYSLDQNYSPFLK